MASLSKKSIRKCIFIIILILGPLIIEFPFVKLKIYHHWKKKSYRSPMEVFGNGMTRGTTGEGVEVTKMKKAA